MAPRVRFLHCHSTFDLGGKEARAVRLMNAQGDAAEHVVLSAVPGAIAARAAIDPAVRVSFAGEEAPPLRGRPSLARYRDLARYMTAFDLVLSYVGGRALEEVKAFLDARHVAPLYGSVDPELHQPVQKSSRYCSDFSYLGTYAADRQQVLEELFLKPAHQLSGQKFLLGGAQYPEDFPWRENIWFVRHVPPRDHPAFYCSSRATLNVTRAAMASIGYCPSGRLFEAAACETPIISDSWEGIEEFFEPGRELLIAESQDDVVELLSRSADELRRIGKAARERVLASHTAEHRSRELVSALEAAA